MLLTYFASGALAAALFRDLRALSCIIPAAGILVFIGLRDGSFAEPLNGLAWFFGHVACFEMGMVMTGIGGAYLQRYFDLRKFGALRRPSAGRVN